MTRIENKHIEDLLPDQNNINKHTQRGHTLVENSIRRRGIGRGILAAGKNTEQPVILAGNLTHEKARDAGINDVIFVHTTGNQLVVTVRDDLDPNSPEAIALAIEDNETGKQSYDPDIDMLAALAAGDNAVLSQLKNEDRIFGGMLEKMGVKGESKDAEPQIDRAAELLEKWQVKTGDLWQIGEHRLLCGDSTKREDVKRVMGGDVVSVVLTDPPYQMGKDMENDSLDDDSFIVLHDGFMNNLPLDKKATIVCFHSPRTFPVALDAGRNAGYKFERMLYMTKPNDISFPWRGWLLISEAILVFSVGGGSWVDVHPYTADTYLFNHSGGEIKDGGDKEARVPLYHPSIKPMVVISDLLSRLGGNIVYDPFLGSGTTIIACQNLSRKGRGIEISPAYCAVTLERMATAFPGIEIKRIQ